MDELRSYLFSKESRLVHLAIPVLAVLAFFPVSGTLLILLIIFNKRNSFVVAQRFLLHFGKSFVCLVRQGCSTTLFSNGSG